MTLKALGLYKIHQSIEQVDSPVSRGMIKRVNYLVKVEEVL